MHKFKIVMTGPGRGKVFIDGQEQEGVERVSFAAGVKEPSRVTLTYLAEDVEVETAEVIDLSAS